MLSSIIVVIAVLAVGGGLSDRLRLAQEELILRKLPVAHAHDYYQLLLKRSRKTRLMRTICLVAMLVILYVWRRTRSH